MAGFWEWYARANDDIRHHLVDRAWFGEHGRDNAFERDVASIADKREPATRQVDATVHTHDPHVPEALEGIGARGADEFNAENVKSVMEQFYGQREDRSGWVDRARETPDFGHER